jgi:hypothetical protein
MALDRTYGVTVVLGVLLVLQSAAQDMRVRAGFLQDSVKVGQQTGFYLAADYPAAMMVLFPDTTHNFSPFEYRGKKYFPTKTTDGRSYDSTVYYLATFEVDAIQRLQLPVYRVNVRDCTIYRSAYDTLFLKSLVRRIPDTLTNQLPLRATVAYQPVSYQVNVPLIVVTLSALLLLAALGWFFFGKEIQRQLLIRRLIRAHSSFMALYGKQVEFISQTFSSENTATALTLWKKHMEFMLGKPYTKLTTRETLALEKDETLAQQLRLVDGAIYGHNVQVVTPLENLQAYAERKFQERLKEVRNGK